MPASHTPPWQKGTQRHQEPASTPEGAVSSRGGGRLPAAAAAPCCWPHRWLKNLSAVEGSREERDSCVYLKDDCSGACRSCIVANRCRHTPEATCNKPTNHPPTHPPTLEQQAVPHERVLSQEQVQAAIRLLNVWGQCGGPVGTSSASACTSWGHHNPANQLLPKSSSSSSSHATDQREAAAPACPPPAPGLLPLAAAVRVLA